MNAKLLWEYADQNGVFRLGYGDLNLVPQEDQELDRVSYSVPEQNGFKVVEDGDKLKIIALGDARLLVGNSLLSQAKIAPGGTIQFSIDEEIGSFTLVGEASVKDPNIGREIGGYKLLGVLGSGAVGVVYRAQQINLDRIVALKVLNSKAATDPLAIASFKREAVSAGRLSHPNLVQVYDVGADNGLHFYSMEMVPGGTLENRLNDLGPIDWREAIEAIMDCALALEYAEEKGLIHRDVKPDNLMIAESGHIKLADLGLATTRGMIDKEVAGGTPHFMAPEATAKSKLDHRADLYSLGCTMFRLLTGETLFSGESVREILQHHQETAPRKLSELGVSVPAEVEELMQELLAKDPDDRPASSTEVVDKCEFLLNKKTNSKVGLVALVLLIAGASYLTFKPQEEDVVNPEVVEVVVNDPEAIAREAELQRQLKEAQAEAQALLNEKENATAPPTDPTLLAAFEFEAELKRLLDDDKHVELLKVLESDYPNLAVRDQQKLQAVFLEDVRKYVASNVAKHAQLLLGENWNGAKLIEAELSELLEVSPSSLVRQEWENELTELMSAREAGISAAHNNSYLKFRTNFMMQMQSGLATTCASFRPDAALSEIQSIVEESRDDRWAKELISSKPLFDSWVEANELILKLISESKLSILHPQFNKKAKVVSWKETGLEVEYQKNGQKVLSMLSWQELMTPPLIEGLLRDSQIAETKQIQVYYLIGSLKVSSYWNEIAVDGFTNKESKLLAAQAASWAWPSKAPHSISDKATLREQGALEAVAGFARASNENNSFQAYLWLNELDAKFSLLGAWISDGSSEFGINIPPLD